MKISTQLRYGFVIIALCLLAFAAEAQRQMETLGRGVVAVRTNSTSVYVGWRMLGTDPEDIGFNLYRMTNGGTAVKVNSSPITNSCNYVDAGATLTVSNYWYVRPVTSGVEWAASASFLLPSNAPVRQYLSVPLQIPPAGTNFLGEVYTYSANDCSVGDLDGDGEYEIILKWDPSNSKDNSQSGFTGPVYLDAYKLNGTRLWRINLGLNIRAGAHYTQFMVYDLDGDGKAELACKTAPGTVDGRTNNVIMPGDDPSIVYTNSSGYILDGPEYLTIFNGQTGAAMVTTNYIPPRGTLSDWGDEYGNRVDRFLACVAYLDGVRPSLVMCRGYYTGAGGKGRTVLAAWDWRNGQLTQRWVFSASLTTNSTYIGQGNHNLSVGDVDGDGKDEIVYGACSIDDNGTGLYTTGWGHGDAMHMSDMDPDRPGLEVWDVHEGANPTCGGGEFRDAKTGALIFGLAGTGDTGRGCAANLTSTKGYQMWSSASGGLYDNQGNNIGSTPGSDNFVVWWDADLLRELEDGTSVTKYGGGTLLTATNCASNNGTKSNPALSVDIFGDWREEVIWRTTDSTALHIYTTVNLATNRFYTLMHDPQYRLAIAWQNTAYNQPPHPGFYLGPGMSRPPRAPISDAALAWCGGSGGNAWDVTTTSNWFVNGIWTNNVLTNFAQGNSVLFDLRGSNNTSVNLAGSLAPAKVTVFSATDYTFAGSGSLTGAMTLSKTGPGRLTVSNTNTYTGSTFVSGGTLFVNGTLPGSAMTVERRGTPEGPSQFGGNGRLGQGLTVQNGCTVIVGAGTNVAGTLTVSNGLTELGNVLNQFDLSSDPTGLTNASDRVNVVGNLVLNGTNTIEVEQLNGFLGSGVYPLFSYTGTLTGGLTNLALTGNFIQFVVLTNPPGVIGLLATIPSAPPAAPSGLTAIAVGAFQIILSWTDNSTNENAFLIERSTNNVIFAQIASVASGTTNYSDFGLTPNTTYYYRVRGTNLAGASGFSNTANATTPGTPPSLTWRGDGTLNVWDIATTANWFDGTNLSLYADGAFVTFNDSGSNSPTINLATNLQPGSVTINAGKNYTFGGAGTLTGAMTLVKSGSGTLTIAMANSFTGGVSANAGTVALGNAAGAGAGPLIFNGGTVSFTVGNQPTYANPLNVIAPSTLVSAGGNNNIVSGAWSGTNTLNLSVATGTFTLGGNMNNFFGTVALGSSAGYFRFYGSTGSTNTTFDLGNGTVTLNNRNGVTVTLGALTGGSGTFVSGAGAADAPSTYIVGGKNLNTTFDGTIKDASASRITSLTKVGTGTLTLTGSNAYSGTTTISGGTLLVNGNQTAATNSVTVGVTGALGGTGTIGGATTVNGTLAPGNSAIGTLTFSKNLTLVGGGMALFEISRSPFTNDMVVVAGNLTCVGTLNVVNTSPDLLEAGDNFKLFDAAGYGGSFTNFNLPDLDEGLAWSTNKLVVDGRLWVVSTNPPAIEHVTVSGGNFTLNGSGGTPGWNYFLLTSTNLMSPLAQWQFIATNQFDTNGNFIVTNLAYTNAPQRFYLLQMQ